MTNIKNITSSFSTNPLFIVIMLLIGLIIVLSIFRSASPFLNIGFGVNAHVGDLKGSFEIEAFENNKGGNFVMYFAEWCGHCKRAKPEFMKLQEEYKKDGLKIMLIDAESPENKELVQSQKVNGFPTIRYYPGEINDNFVEYGDNRTYDDFVKFLDNQ